MSAYAIRQATVADLPEMQRVITDAMIRYAEDSSIPTPLESLTETIEDLRRHVLQDYFILAFRGEKLVGTLRISRMNDPATPSAYISRFAVLPSMQKLGVGNALFSKAEEYLHSGGYRRVFLHTALTNARLVKFYTSRKFDLVETGTERGYPRGTFMKEYR